MVMCDSSVYFLASKKKIEFIRQVDPGKEAADIGLPVFHLLIRNKVIFRGYNIEDVHFCPIS